MRIKQEPIFSAEYSGLYKFTDLSDKPQIEQTTEFETKLSFEEGTISEKAAQLNNRIKEIESKRELTVDKDYKERISSLKQITQYSLVALKSVAEKAPNLIYEKVIQIKVEGPTKIQYMPDEIKIKIAKTLKSKFGDEGKLIYLFTYYSYRREVRMAIPDLLGPALQNRMGKMTLLLTREP